MLLLFTQEAAKKLKDKTLVTKKKLRNQELLENRLNRLNEQKLEEGRDQPEIDEDENGDEKTDLSSVPSTSNEKQEIVDEYDFDSSDEEVNHRLLIFEN